VAVERRARLVETYHSVRSRERSAIRPGISRDCMLPTSTDTAPTLRRIQRLRYGARSADTTVCVAQKKRVAIIVRRGALRTFDALTRKTADLPVVVSWDRRTEDRRASSESASVERRSSERRRTQPFTWDTADFVVDTPASGEPRADADSTAPAQRVAPAHKTAPITRQRKQKKKT
jgi:hypothetical protein